MLKGYGETVIGLGVTCGPAIGGGLFKFMFMIYSIDWFYKCCVFIEVYILARRVHDCVWWCWCAHSYKYSVDLVSFTKG
ncbi:hypothetical protein EB796_015429 [Bugula neritina]|uniref:Uncharacterized protein n=1 Tax=Bugula neritina TaxID=10212 RepID=A0A7J7JJJ2_BUGNE|nr:hypothetical protein EB796_015429 [Bugula neritina]